MSFADSSDVRYRQVEQYLDNTWRKAREVAQRAGVSEASAILGLRHGADHRLCERRYDSTSLDLVALYRRKQVAA